MALIFSRGCRSISPIFLQQAPIRPTCTCTVQARLRQLRAAEPENPATRRSRTQPRHHATPAEGALQFQHLLAGQAVSDRQSGLGDYVGVGARGSVRDRAGGRASVRGEVDRGSASQSFSAGAATRNSPARQPTQSGPASPSVLGELGQRPHVIVLEGLVQLRAAGRQFPAGGPGTCPCRPPPSLQRAPSSGQPARH